MSFFSNPFKSSWNLFKKTAPPIPVVNSHGTPGVYLPGRDNAFYPFHNGTRKNVGAVHGDHSGMYRSRYSAHASPIMFGGHRIMEQ